MDKDGTVDIQSPIVWCAIGYSQLITFANYAKSLFGTLHPLPNLTVAINIFLAVGEEGNGVSFQL